jgi:transcriptional regulator with XRE-family HTH domain
MDSTGIAREGVGVSPGQRRTPLARRLRELRTNQTSQWPRQLTQATLARLLLVAETTVSSYETGQAAPGDDKLRTYATLFSTPRSIANGQVRVLAEAELTAAERAACDALLLELRRLRDHGASTHAHARRSTWQFPDEIPIRLVCGRIPAKDVSGLADPKHPNFTRLLSYADLDAMVELFGHIRAENPTVDVRFMQPDDMSDGEFSHHVVVVGGLEWNDMTESFLGVLDDLPVQQVKHPDFEDGEIFVVDPADGGERIEFKPQYRAQLNKGATSRYVEDVGYFARVPNPYNLTATLTICNGVHSRGVLGAVRMLTDSILRERNEGYLGSRFGDSRRYGMLFRVPINGGRTVTPELSNPRTRLFEWTRE